MLGGSREANLRIVLLLALTFQLSAGESKNQGKLIPFKLPIYGKKDQHFDLNQYLGKKTIYINFFATWCTNCIAEIPELHQLMDKYQDVVYVAVNAGERSKKIRKFLKKHPFRFTIVEDKNRKMSEKMGVESLPYSMIISKDKKIVYQSDKPPKKI